MDHLELANRLREQKLLEKIDLMRKLHSPEGFYLYWFENLRKFEGYGVNKACFDAANDLYFELFLEYRYSDYNSFRRYITRRNKSIKK